VYATASGDIRYDNHLVPLKPQLQTWYDLEYTPYYLNSDGKVRYSFHVDKATPHPAPAIAPDADFVPAATQDIAPAEFAPVEDFVPAEEFAPAQDFGADLDFDAGVKSGPAPGFLPAPDNVPAPDFALAPDFPPLDRMPPLCSLAAGPPPSRMYLCQLQDQYSPQPGLLLRWLYLGQMARLAHRFRSADCSCSRSGFRLPAGSRTACVVEPLPERRLS